jgi:hypothetical protein
LLGQQIAINFVVTVLKEQGFATKQRACIGNALSYGMANSGGDYMSRPRKPAQLLLSLDNPNLTTTSYGTTGKLIELAASGLCQIRSVAFW